MISLGLVACGGDDDSSESISDNAPDLLEDEASSTNDDSSDEVDDVFGDVEIPDDIPLPVDHEIIQAIGNPEAGYTIVAKTPMSLGDAADFYESELPNGGWESLEREEPEGAEVIMIETARPSDGHGLLVQIQPDGDGSSLQILTGPPPGN